MAKYLLWAFIVILFFWTTFGLYFCVMIVFSLFTFLLGVFSLLYIEEGHIEKFYKNCAGNPLTSKEISEGGLKQIIKELQSLKTNSKVDTRVTGSELIDASLQEILGYIIRDYILPWYTVVTNDKEFPAFTIKRTTRTLAVNVSNRIKEVDWIPYITTRLVDDGATHLKLFKQAFYRKEQYTKFEYNRDSPLADNKYSSKKSHKRTKSEPDVSFSNNKHGRENEESACDTINSKFHMEPNKKYVLEDYFFDLECQMEKKLLCRDAVCMNSEKEKEYLSELTELLLYLLLPDEDFQCKPLQYLLREILVNCLFLPLFNMICDPDFINQTLIWLCFRESTTLSEIFITAIRLSDNILELKYSKEMLNREIHNLRSRDCGGENDMLVKQQLSSLAYVKKLIDNRLLKLENMETSAAPELEALDNVKIKLPLDVILKNNIALSYFIDFISKTDYQMYLFFYLNVEGWKISVEQQLSDLHLNKSKSQGDSALNIYDNIRATALTIFEQYLSERSEQKMCLPRSLVQTIFFKIRNLTEQPSELWFDDVQSAVYKKMQEEVLPSFHYSKTYLRLLEELDLLQYHTVDEDNLSLGSLELVDPFNDEKLAISTASTSNNINKIENREQTSSSKDSLNQLNLNSNQKATKHARSFSDITDFNIRTASETSVESSQNNDYVENDIINELQNLKYGPFSLEVRIIETGIVCEKGKTFGVYAVHVKCNYETGFVEEWHIYRRYSDFYDLQQRVKDKFPNLSKLPFPGKKTFHNMERSVLEKRMQMLGFYLKQLCRPDVLSSHYDLQSLLMTFLEQGDYDRVTSGGPISHTIDTLVHPFKSGIKTIRNVPEQLINTMDEVVEGISKVFQTRNPNQESSKVGASLDTEGGDNIPLRIILLLMDEVFDLKSRNQWLRRRIVTLLRQIIHAMFGDIVNRKIVDYVSYITSPKNVAHYLQAFKQSFWPNGKRIEKRPQRDEAVRFRTRIAAKIALLSCLSDELKHIIGSETTRRGLLTVFELFQKPILNRRLLYVLLEGIICTLFPEKNMDELFQKCHSKSKRLNSATI